MLFDSRLQNYFLSIWPPNDADAKMGGDRRRPGARRAPEIEQALTANRCGFSEGGFSEGSEWYKNL